jgi:hypothetical protein
MHRFMSASARLNDRALGIERFCSVAVHSDRDCRISMLDRDSLCRMPSRLRVSLDLESEGNEMLELIGELFPICRSITGMGCVEVSRDLATCSLFRVVTSQFPNASR